MRSDASNTFSKAERLSSKKDISRLLNHGKWGSCNALKYCILSPNGAGINRLVVAVPKKYFKRAVKRNLLKRRIREAYRTQKGLAAACGADILIQYESQEILDFQTIYELVGRILRMVK